MAKKKLSRSRANDEHAKKQWLGFLIILVMTVSVLAAILAITLR
jgi:hypothetical protein